MCWWRGDSEALVNNEIQNRLIGHLFMIHLGLLNLVAMYIVLLLSLDYEFRWPQKAKICICNMVWRISGELELNWFGGQTHEALLTNAYYEWMLPNIGAVALCNTKDCYLTMSGPILSFLTSRVGIFGMSGPLVQCPTHIVHDGPLIGPRVAGLLETEYSLTFAPVQGFQFNKASFCQ